MVQINENELFLLISESIKNTLNEGKGDGHTNKKEITAMSYNGKHVAKVKCNPGDSNSINAAVIGKDTNTDVEGNREKRKAAKAKRKAIGKEKATQRERYRKQGGEQLSMDLQETVSRIIKNYIR